MSVWDVISYRAEPLIKSIQNHGKSKKAKELATFYFETDFIVDDELALSSKTNDRVRSNTITVKNPILFRDYCRTNKKFWAEFVREHRGKQLEDQFYTTTKHLLEPKHYGIKAVYWTFKRLLRDGKNFKQKIPKEEQEEFIKEVWKLSAAPSRINQKSWDKLGESIQEAQKASTSGLENINQVVRHIWYQGRDNDFIKRQRKFVKIMKSPYSETEKFKYKSALKLLPYIWTTSGDSITSGGIKFIRFRNGYFVYDPGIGETAVLFFKDHSRLIEMITSMCRITDYFCTYDYYNPDLNKVMMKKLDYIIELAFSKVDNMRPNDCNSLCRSFDVLLSTYFSTIACDIDNKSLLTQQQKFRDEGLIRFFNQDEVLSKINDNRLGVKEILEILKVYKMFPAPDFCHFSGIPNVARANLKMNPMNINQTITSPSGIDIIISEDEFDLYQMRSLLVTFHSRHDRLPGHLKDRNDIPEHLLEYPDVKLSAVSVNDMAYIDIKGTFMWKSFQNIEHELCKDKAIAPSIKDDNLNFTRWDDNQILKMLFDEKFLSQDEIHKMFDIRMVKYEKHIKIAWKGESKKPDSRIFFIGADEDRRMLSEFEINVFDYIKNRPGSSQGKSETSLFETMHNMYIRNVEGTDKFLISFDIKSWSPNMAKSFKYLGLKKWAHAFGKPEILEVMQIFDDREVYVDKLGHKDSFNLVGSDMEGFNGRMNTDLHIDVMSYSVYKLRQSQIITEPAQFLALIDDGLLEAAVPNNDPEFIYEDRIKDIIYLIDKIYEAFGLVISWDKTYLSKFFQMYLNEINIDGQRVSPGIKSFLKIGQPQKTPIENLMDELMSHASTTRGAIKANADHNLCYMAYIKEYYKSLKKWNNYKELDVKDLALRVFMPYQVGGFALNSLYSLATNETFDTFQSCSASCWLISKCFASTAKYYESKFSIVPNESDPGLILRNPRTLRFDVPHISNMKFQNMTRAFVLKKSLFPLIVDISTQISNLHDDPFTCIVANSYVISEVVRDLLWAMDPKSMIETIVGKLQTGEAAAKLLGKARVMAVNLVYRKQAQNVISNK